MHSKFLIYSIFIAVFFLAISSIIPVNYFSMPVSTNVERSYGFPFEFIRYTQGDFTNPHYAFNLTALFFNFIIYVIVACAIFYVTRLLKNLG